MISTVKKTTNEQECDWITLNMSDPFLSQRLHCSGVGENIFNSNQEILLNAAISQAGLVADYGIFAVSKGRLDVVVKKKDLSESCFLLEAGSALIIPPHAIISPKSSDCDGEYVCIFLGGSIAKDIFDTMIQKFESVVFTKDIYPAIQKIKQLMNSLYVGVYADDCYISEFLYQLLMQFYRISVNIESYSYPPMVASALKIIREEYAYLYGIDELASTLNVSKSHLIRVFTKAVGISPGKHLTQIRMENAKLLLVGGAYSVETISNLIGYGDSNYFCKVFKKDTGMTPREFTRSHSHAKKQLPKHIEKSEGFLY